MIAWGLRWYLRKLRIVKADLSVANFGGAVVMRTSDVRDVSGVLALKVRPHPRQVLSRGLCR